MKIKLDENLPAELADLLTGASHDVHTVPGEFLAGRDDQTIFRAAVSEGRVLFTQDLDFSDLRQFKPGTHAGVVLIRLRDPSRRRLIARVRQVIASESLDSWAGCFVVISDHKLRIRRPTP
jgi:predicted nuclease of predicted toxin-antitoxin system